MTTERIIRAEEKGWALTDDDCFQWQRGVIKQERPFAQCFEMCQITKIGDEYRVCHGVVVINDVPYEELEVLVKMFGYICIYIHIKCPQVLCLKDSIFSEKSRLTD